MMKAQVKKSKEKKIWVNYYKKCNNLKKNKNFLLKILNLQSQNNVTVLLVEISYLREIILFFLEEKKYFSIVASK